MLGECFPWDVTWQRTGIQSGRPRVLSYLQKPLPQLLSWCDSTVDSSLTQHIICTLSDWVQTCSLIPLHTRHFLDWSFVPVPGRFVIVILMFLPYGSDLGPDTVCTLDSWASKAREEKCPAWGELPLEQQWGQSSVSPIPFLALHPAHPLQWVSTGTSLLDQTQPVPSNLKNSLMFFGGKLLKYELPFPICKMKRAEKMLRDTCRMVKSGMRNKLDLGHAVAEAKTMIGGGTFGHISPLSSLWLSDHANSYALHMGPDQSLQLG